MFHFSHVHVANNALLGCGVRVCVREQRKINKGTTKPLIANLDITLPFVSILFFTTCGQVIETHEYGSKVLSCGLWLSQAKYFFTRRPPPEAEIA